MKLKQTRNSTHAHGRNSAVRVVQSGPKRRSARGRFISPRSAAAEVEVTRVVAQKLNTTVKLPAQLTAYEVVDVYPKVTGFVKWIKVDRGSRVRAGEADCATRGAGIIGTAGGGGIQIPKRRIATFRRTSQICRGPGDVPTDERRGQDPRRGGSKRSGGRAEERPSGPGQR